MQRSQRSLWAWALYDWANSAWATAVLAGFFPVLFRQQWALGLAPSEKTFALGAVNAAAGLAVALLAVFVGAFGDRRRMRKRLLLAFAGLGVFATGLLAFVPEGAWPLAGLCFALAAVGFSCANLFYDALIVAVASPAQYARASSLGYALGYLGGGLFFALAVAFVLWAEREGLAPELAMRASIAACALWWASFSLPLVRWVAEPEARGLLQVRGVVRQLWGKKAVVWFLAGYFLYIDGVGSVIRMAGDFALAIGLAPQAVIAALLLVQFVAWPAAVLAGRLAERFGTGKVLLAQVWLFAAICFAAYGVHTPAQFFALAASIGGVLGGVQALSRAHFAAMTPAAEMGAWFGFFNMFGKFAAVLGPIWVGAVVWLWDAPRLAAPAAAVLIVLGAWLLRRSLQMGR